jgi:enoyl-CoA hydratase/carnithine racemase
MRPTGWAADVPREGRTKMAEDAVLYDVKDRIAHITLNKPDNMNRFDAELCGALREAWKRFEDDPEARVALLGANGDHFSWGAELTAGELMTQSGLQRTLLGAFPANGVRVFKPIVGAVHGMAIGTGYGMAVHGTDITYATEDTQFIFGEVWVGIVGMVMEYAPYMPFKVAMEFLLSGKPMSGRRAFEVGLVNHVCADREEMTEQALKMARTLARNAPLTLKAIKFGHYKVMETEAQRAMRQARHEFKAFIQPQLDSEDFKEGVRAMLEGRKPEFQGR